jgi:hypothetical protein|tara:strand:+ start:728 stop:901 length:174 start_codon:yes stop_codon:yes gene_type:complete
MKIKDKMKIDNQRLYKTDFLNRPVKTEQNRVRVFKELVALGMPHYNAYQISIRRMKE